MRVAADLNSLDLAQLFPKGGHVLEVLRCAENNGARELEAVVEEGRHTLKVVLWTRLPRCPLDMPRREQLCKVDGPVAARVLLLIPVGEQLTVNCLEVAV